MTLTPAEEQELAGFEGFVELLGVGELEEEEFQRYLALLGKRKEGS